MSELKRKRLSGSQYKKQKNLKENEMKKMKGSLDQFFINKTPSQPSVSTSTDEICVQIGDKEDEPNIDDIVPENSEAEQSINFVATDPGQWKNLSSSQRKLIIEKGPVQVRGVVYPKDRNGRHFSDNFFKRKMPNGELLDRRWLIYSISTDHIYCFCCFMFDNSEIDSKNWSAFGFQDWKNASRAIKLHETSKKHMECFQSWMELDNRQKNNKTIDCENKRIRNLERQRWRDILTRIIASVQLCATQQLALRGNSNKLFVSDNGNFLKILECFSAFDATTRDHLMKSMKHKNNVHYMSKNIQNDIIKLMGVKVRRTIISMIKEAKYYSIILDCTPDISHVEQMSVCVRLVNKEMQSEYAPREYFINFLPVESSTGENLTRIIIKELESHGLKIENLRGQGYDNGANMKGVNSGVQNRILQINPRAFFVPCACHSLNLVVNDAASASGEIVNFFSIVQELYVFFSSSPKRWDVLKKHISSLTLKSVCSTRWASRVEALTPLRYQLGEVYDALVEISLDINRDADTKNKSKSLANKISKFQFICGIVVWFEVLSKINIVSKVLQSPQMVIPECIKLLKNIIKFLKEYRDNGFEQMLCTAKEIASEMEVTSTFEIEASVRIRRKRKIFDYEGIDTPISDPTLNFKVSFFYYIIDVCAARSTERFSQLENHSNTFEFLYNIPTLSQKENLLECCEKLSRELSAGDQIDVEPFELRTELKIISNILDKDMTPLEVLNYIDRNNLTDNFPNICIAVRILLTLPVSVAAGERSFSKLKLIKTYLRSVMSQDRLTNLAILSIENKLCSSLKFDDIIDDFSKEKVRKIQFH